MYRSNLGTKDKSGAMIAVVAIHALLLLALLHLSGTLPTVETQAVLRVFDLAEPLTPTPTPPPPQQQQAAPKPKAPQGGSAPAHIKSQATPVVAPKPPVPLTTPVVAAKTPAQGTAATEGAAPVAGPGTGAGGSGNGTGSGSGIGSGSGSGGGVVSPPRLVTPVLRGRDFDRQLLDDWPRGAPVFLRLRVDPQGNVAECIVDRGTGVAAIDSTVCVQVHQRLRFRPALNASGQAVAGWFGYVQTPPR